MDTAGTRKPRWRRKAPDVYFLRDGKIARIEYYANRAEALEAVGLARRDSQKSS